MIVAKKIIQTVNSHIISNNRIYMKNMKAGIPYFDQEVLSPYDLINEKIKDYDLIINTTPLGTFPDVSKKPVIS